MLKFNIVLACLLSINLTSRNCLHPEAVSWKTSCDISTLLEGVAQDLTEIVCARNSNLSFCKALKNEGYEDKILNTHSDIRVVPQPPILPPAISGQKEIPEETSAKSINNLFHESHMNTDANTTMTYANSGDSPSKMAKESKVLAESVLLRIPEPSSTAAMVSKVTESEPKEGLMSSANSQWHLVEVPEIPSKFKSQEASRKHHTGLTGDIENNPSAIARSSISAVDIPDAPQASGRFSSHTSDSWNPFLSKNLRTNGTRNQARFNEGGFNSFRNRAGAGLLDGIFGFQQSSGIGLPFGLGSIGFSSGVGVGK